jgi:hypothetical protein
MLSDLTKIFESTQNNQEKHFKQQQECSKAGIDIKYLRNTKVASVA